MLSHKSLQIKQWSNLFVFLHDDFNGKVAVHIQCISHRSKVLWKVLSIFKIIFLLFPVSYWRGELKK